MGDLLLRDYAPRSTLELEEHFVQKPRFPVIDAHNHLTWVEGTLATLDVAALLNVMDECGIRAIVNLDGWGENLEAHLDKYDRAYPGRFATFACVDWSKLDEPGFGEKAAKRLERKVAEGARGLKIFKELGMGYRDRSGRLVSPDDERWDPIWAKAGELGVPVMIHLGDLKSYWDPLDRFNENYLVLKKWSGSHHYGKDCPSFRELIDAGIRLIRRHPDTTFIAAHTGWYSENLRFVGEQMLDELPNLYIDFSARIVHLGRQPYTARKFLIKYQDRVLFGTDALPSEEVYGIHYRWLETADEYFEVSLGPPRSTRRIYGVYLPDEVLERIYHKNAERVIPGLA